MSVNAEPFGQLLVAAVTPFHPDGSLNLDGFVAHVDSMFGGGADGVVVAGTTGESSTVTSSEHRDLLRAAVNRAGSDGSIIAAVRGADTADAIMQARSAQDAGADALMVGTPPYSRPGQSGVLAHIWAVADATSLPVMLYDAPARTASALGEETVLRAAEHPAICAIKDASGSLATADRLIGNSGLRYFAGDDFAALPTLAIGGTGVVSVTANLLPRSFRDLVDAVRSGDLRAATEIHRGLAPVIRALTTRAPAAVATKLVLHGLERIASPRVRLPLVGPEPTEVELIHADLTTAGRLGGLDLAHVVLDHHAAYGGALALPADRWV